jgi:hypothetical protein
MVAISEHGWIGEPNAGRPSGVVKGESARLTTTQVSLIAAGIALAAPAITDRANARLDRDRWVRERRAEAYIDALAVLGRIAAYVTDPSSRPHPFDAVPGDQWRVFQARVEAFASAAVVALRNDLLGAWNGYRAEMDALDAAPDGAGFCPPSTRRGTLPGPGPRSL